MKLRVPMPRSLRSRLLLACSLVEIVLLSLLLSNSVRLINEALELRRLKLCLDNFVATPEVKKNGLGTLDRTRLADTTRLVVEAFGLKNPVNATVMFNPLFMPPAAERTI